MNYTPEYLENINFCRALLGYNKSQVDEVIAKIINDYNQSNAEITELERRVSEMNDTVQHYKSIEESLQHSVIIAHHTSNTIKENACEKAKTIIEEAEITSRKMVNDANQEISKIKLEYDDIKNKVFTFKSKSKALLQSQLEVLEHLNE